MTRLFSPSDFSGAKQLLLEGKVVAFPTETVYGLGASLLHEEGILKVFQVKNRPQDNPLIVHIFSLIQLEELVEEVPPILYSLAKAFWPGPLTCVLKKKKGVTSLVSAGLDSIAIRMPSHPVALQLLQAVNVPLVGPSANRSGRPSPTQACHVLEDLDGLIDGILDGGDCEVGVESTVISLLDEEVILLRPGSIEAAEIEKVIGRKIAVYSGKQEERVCSPGMKYRHYAPDCLLVLCYDKKEVSTLLQAKKGEKWMILSSAQTCTEWREREGFFPLSRASLYALLRKADREQYHGIVVFCDPILMQDRALMNRLLKGSGTKQACD